MPTAAQLEEDKDEFHSSLRIYLNALEMLAAPAEEQCQMMGDYNVAWELKEDVQNGQYLVSRGYLSEDEEQWILALARAFDAVNTQVLPAGPGRAASLAAMSRPAWEPHRYLAAEVLRQLSKLATANAEYLALGNSAA
jgi:hypothetical protein